MDRPGLGLLDVAGCADVSGAVLARQAWTQSMTNQRLRREQRWQAEGCAPLGIAWAGHSSKQPRSYRMLSLVHERAPW